MQGFEVIIAIAIVIMSVVIHEVSHGYAAYMLGDKTAAYEGRLTLNPFKHLDFVGSVLVPLLTYASGGFILGWAKPVPFNPYNLRSARWGEAIVAAAGPLSNICLAVLFSIVLRLGIITERLSPSFIELASLVVLINLGLAFFNLVPIPPLDGSKIIFSFFPARFTAIREGMERSSLILLLIFVFFFSRILLPLVVGAFTLLTGI